MLEGGRQTLITDHKRLKREYAPCEAQTHDLQTAQLMTDKQASATSIKYYLKHTQLVLSLFK
jgi:hypothetical protein